MDPNPFKARVSEIFSRLEEYNYYQLLNLKREATPEEIQQSFHKLALTMHPDRHAQSDDAALRSMLYAIYKRVTEAYRVLSNHVRRKNYDEQLAQGQKRLAHQKEAVSKQVKAELSITDPKAKKFYQLGLQAERRSDFKTARLNYKFALDLLGEHPTLRERINAVEAADGASADASGKRKS